LGHLESPQQPINTVTFFKIDEYAQVPGTQNKWASDKLISQNYTWTSRIPSDIKPGLYILRHELLALHDAGRSYNGMSQSGAQFFPVCYNVEFVGNGTASPPGKTFPGMYATNDLGVKVNLNNPAARLSYVSAS
jgi:cellulase